MRWDDLQLLRLIDEFEESEQAGHLASGYNLMQAAAGGQPIDWDRDCRTFARELLLAHHAGYLEWRGPFNLESARSIRSQAVPPPCARSRGVISVLY